MVAGHSENENKDEYGWNQPTLLKRANSVARDDLDIHVWLQCSFSCGAGRRHCKSCSKKCFLHNIPHISFSARAQILGSPKW